MVIKGQNVLGGCCMKSGITHDDWTAALTEITGTVYALDDPTICTARELGVLWGCTLGTATRRVKKLIAAGRAQSVKKLIRHSDGVVHVAPAYLLVKKK
jgi:hypothetical protein